MTKGNNSSPPVKALVLIFISIWISSATLSNKKIETLNRNITELCILIEKLEPDLDPLICWSLDIPQITE